MHAVINFLPTPKSDDTPPDRERLLKNWWEGGNGGAEKSGRRFTPASGWSRRSHFVDNLCSEELPF
jgi:hypothetical protein